MLSSSGHFHIYIVILSSCGQDDHITSCHSGGGPYVQRTAGVFGPGSLIGEMALWEGGTRSAAWAYTRPPFSLT
jgi:CRP-like cAMP-binding protein